MNVWTELEASDNPLATVVMVHLKTRATRKDVGGRLHWKLQMVRHLYERGFGRRDAEKLFRWQRSPSLTCMHVLPTMQARCNTHFATSLPISTEPSVKPPASNARA